MTLLDFREKVSMKIFVKAIILCLLSTLPLLAEQSLALVTEVEGKVHRADKAQLQLLDYLGPGDKAVVEGGGRLVVSYVKGGLRATAVGPCVVQVNENGPVLLKGKSSQLSSSQPAKRVGHRLPSKFETQSGSIRRGVLDLHLPRKFLPGPIEVKFTALPMLTDFELIVFDSTTNQEVYSQELASGHSFLIPADALKSGAAYDFEIAASGGKEASVKGRVIVSESLAAELEEQIAERKAATDFPTKAELLSIYLGHGLDDRALPLVEELLEQNQGQEKLEEIQRNLRSMLNYQ